MWKVNNSFCEVIWRIDEKREKSRENPEKIQKPENDAENNIIKSYLISKLSIMSRNIVQTNEIRRFEKSDKKTTKKSDFETSELRSRSKKWIVYSIKQQWAVIWLQLVVYFQTPSHMDQNILFSKCFHVKNGLQRPSKTL